MYRLRLNLNYTLQRQLLHGAGCRHQRPVRSTRTKSITEGFDDYGIYLHQFLLGYKATDWATVVIGKQFAPFYNNEDAMVDFGDITPTGVTEKFNFARSPRP